MNNKCIRVLSILPSLYTAGGVQTFIMSYYRNIDKSKVQLDFLVNKDEQPSFEEEIKKLGGNIYYLPPFSLTNLPAIRRVADKFFSEHHYKIVHCHAPNEAFLYFPIAKRYGASVRILHGHATKGGETALHAVRNYPLHRIGRMFATHYAACSRMAGEFLFKGKAYHQIYNAVDCDKFAYDQAARDKLRQEFGLENKFVVGHVGRFMPQKNHAFIINFFKKVVQERPDAVLCLVGDGPLRKEIESLAEPIKNNVLFLGTRDDVNKLYSMFDVFILPSLFEGLSVAAVEAQCSGLKIYASDTVSLETRISNLMELVSLSEDEWVERLLQAEPYKRYTHINDLTNCGYNIKSEASNLEEYYLSLENL